MKKFGTLALLILMSASAFAGSVSFKQSSTVDVNDEPLNNELCKVKNALTHYFSNDLKCTGINIDYNAGDDQFVINGSADCPTLTSLQVLVKLAPCEECQTHTIISMLDTSGKSSRSTITTSEADYLCQ